MIVVGDYIVATESNDLNHAEIIAKIAEKPEDPDGYVYMLRADNLNWELVETPPSPDPELDDAEALEILLGGDGE